MSINARFFYIPTNNSASTKTIGNEMIVLSMNIAISSHMDTGIFDFRSSAPTSEK